MTAQTSHTRSTKSRPGARGFTLAEALIASVFLAIAVVGVAGTMMESQRTQEQLSQGINCQALAKQLLEEMSSRSFTAQPNPGYKLGYKDRSTYDDPGDYDGYTDNSTTGIKTLDGSVVDFGDNVTYTRTAAFEYRTTPGGGAAGSGDFGLATVTVTASSGASVTLQRVLSNSSFTRQNLE